MTEEEKKRTDLIHNEQIKLRATWLNNVGVGCLIAGCVAPSISLIISEQASAWSLILLTAPWLLIGTALHYLATVFLRRLR